MIPGVKFTPKRLYTTTGTARERAAQYWARQQAAPGAVPQPPCTHAAAPPPPAPAGDAPCPVAYIHDAPLWFFGD